MGGHSTFVYDHDKNGDVDAKSACLARFTEDLSIHPSRSTADPLSDTYFDSLLTRPTNTNDSTNALLYVAPSQVSVAI